MHVIFSASARKRSVSVIRPIEGRVHHVGKGGTAKNKTKRETLLVCVRVRFFGVLAATPLANHHTRVYPKKRMFQPIVGVFIRLEYAPLRENQLVADSGVHQWLPLFNSCHPSHLERVAPSYTVPQKMNSSRIFVRRSSSRAHSMLAFFAISVSLVFLAGIDNTDAGWVDPDTPKEFFTTQALTQGDDREYELVRLFLPYT